MDVQLGAEWTADSRALFEGAHHRTLGWGVWLRTLSPSTVRQILKVDDPNSEMGGALEASATRFYFSITRRESDIWTANITSR